MIFFVLFWPTGLGSCQIILKMRKMDSLENFTLISGQIKVIAPPPSGQIGLEHRGGSNAPPRDNFGLWPKNPKIGACGAKIFKNQLFSRRFPLYKSHFGRSKSAKFSPPAVEMQKYVISWDLPTAGGENFGKVNSFLGGFPFRNGIL